MIRTFLTFTFFSLLFFCCSQKETKHEISDWHGPNRDGIYHEKNLLKQWPENGPEMLWSFEGLGFGHSSVAVANNKVYVTGIKDTISSDGTLYTFDMYGKLIWQKVYGKDFTWNFHGTRSTPVVYDRG